MLNSKGNRFGYGELRVEGVNCMEKLQMIRNDSETLCDQLSLKSLIIAGGGGRMNGKITNGQK